MYKTLLFTCLLLLIPAAEAADGERLYAENCAICHGTQGTGGVGIPLSLAEFLQQTPDEYLRRSIRYGRPGRVMPAFPHLGNDAIDAIVQYIRGWNPEIAAPPWDESTIVGNTARGLQLYQQHCAECHHDKGSGGRGTGVKFSRPMELPIIAPAIGNPGFLQSANDLMLKTIIMQGRKHTPMPSAASLKLSETDVNDIVSYLRSLQTPLQTSKQTTEEEPAALIYESSYNFEDTINNVKRAAVGMNFRLIRDQYLDNGFVAEGQEDQHYMMVYFCNFKFLYDALALDPRVGLFLPCRVTVIQQGDKVKVMSINPKRLSRLFNNNELDQACDEMYKLYSSILEEATL
ncbi:MAG: c-type cytochrome [Gammaproteobacteria bacterium]|nr:MAG: c-type cytochrome [Gammaproteobacteria bacterium]